MTLPTGEMCSSFSKSSLKPPNHCLSVTWKEGCRRFDAVSSGPKMRKSERFLLIRSAVYSPSTRVASVAPKPWPFSPTGISYSRASGRSSDWRRRPPLALGLAPRRSSPAGMKDVTSGRMAPSSSKSCSGLYDSSQSRRIWKWASVSRADARGTWCARHEPSVFLPSI